MVSHAPQNLPNLSEHVSGLSPISEPCFKAVNFAEEKEGRKLNGSVIKKMQVDTEGACRLRYVNEEQCRSYNLGLKKHKAENFLCQLNGSDKFSGFGNFLKDDNFKYRGIKVLKLKRGMASKGPGGGATPYNGLYGRAPPERGTFFRLQVYERVGILLFEVYERVGKRSKFTLGNFCFNSGQLFSGPCEDWFLRKTNSRWRREARRTTADYKGIEEP